MTQMHSFSNSDKNDLQVFTNLHQRYDINSISSFLGCPDPCRCTTADGIMRAVTRIECKGKHLQSVPRRLPCSTEKL